MLPAGPCAASHAPPFSHILLPPAAAARGCAPLMPLPLTPSASHALVCLPFYPNVSSPTCQGRVGADEPTAQYSGQLLLYAYARHCPVPPACMLCIFPPCGRQPPISQLPYFIGSNGARALSACRRPAPCQGRQALMCACPTPAANSSLLTPVCAGPLAVPLHHCTIPVNESSMPPQCRFLLLYMAKEFHPWVYFSAHQYLPLCPGRRLDTGWGRAGRPPFPSAPSPPPAAHFEH